MTAPAEQRIADAIERLGWAECTREQFNPRTGEYYDAPCSHCDLIAILEGGERR